MEKIKKILAPTDFSELSKVGVRYALNLAKSTGTEVTVYHVVTPGELMDSSIEINEEFRGYVPHPLRNPLETYQRVLARFLKDHFSDHIRQVSIREKVQLGVPHKSIVELAETDGSDLIVISTHGRTGFSHMLVGSVTERVVREAPCPVLSIHPQAKEKASEGFVGMT